MFKSYISGWTEVLRREQSSTKDFCENRSLRWCRTIQSCHAGAANAYAYLEQPAIETSQNDPNCLFKLPARLSSSIPTAAPEDRYSTSSNRLLWSSWYKSADSDKHFQSCLSRSAFSNDQAGVPKQHWNSVWASHLAASLVIPRAHQIRW